MNRREFLLAVPAVAVVSAAQHGRRDAIDQQAYPPSCANEHRLAELALLNSYGVAWKCPKCGAMCVRMSSAMIGGRPILQWFRHRH